MKGILLSLGILIPTILPSQTRLVPFPGIFSTYIGAHLSKRQFRLCPLSRELFFNPKKTAQHCAPHSFRPLSRGPFFNQRRGFTETRHGALFSSPFSGNFFQWGETVCHREREYVFVPFLGDFFSIAYYCQCMHYMAVTGFSSPFLGTFFQWGLRKQM